MNNPAHDRGESNQVKLAQTVKVLRDNLLAMIEFEQLQAKLTRAKYLALIEQGFTQDEALKLCQRAA